MGIVTPSWYAAPWASAQALALLSPARMAAGFPSGLAQRPTRQDLNRALEFASNGVLYFMSHGVPEWLTEAQYPTGSVVAHAGRYWRANALLQGAEPGSGAWEALPWRRSELDALYLARDVGDALFLNAATADARFYPRAEMTATFITPADMAAQFAPVSSLLPLLTQLMANAQFITQAQGDARWALLGDSVPLDDLAALLALLLSRTDASANFISTLEPQRWLNGQTAPSILVTQTQAAETMQDKETAAISVFSPAHTYRAGVLVVGTPPPTALLQINCGGDAVPPFEADRDYSGGTPYMWGGTVDLSQVTNPAPTVVYQSARMTNTYNYYQVTWITSYQFANLPPKLRCRLRLHFWTYFLGETGFNVRVNGAVILSNFIISEAAGGIFRAYIHEEDIEIDAAGGLLLEFYRSPEAIEGTIAQVKISGIELQTIPPTRIYRSQADGNVGNALTDTAWWRPWSLPTHRPTESFDGRLVRRLAYMTHGEYLLQASAIPALEDYPEGILMKFVLKGEGGTIAMGGSDGASEAETLEVIASNVRAADFPLLLSVGDPARNPQSTGIMGHGGVNMLTLNAAGDAVDGWLGDESGDFSASEISHFDTNPIDLSKVVNPAPEVVYRLHRYSHEFFTLTIPALAPGGTYRFRFHFCDISTNVVGERLFNIYSQGQLIIANLDIVAAVGAGWTAYIVDWLIVADASGTVVLKFEKAGGNHAAQLCGLEIGAPVYFAASGGYAQKVDRPAYGGKQYIVDPPFPVLSQRSITGADGRWSTPGMRWGHGGGVHGSSGMMVGGPMPSNLALYGGGAGNADYSPPRPGGDGFIEIYTPYAKRRKTHLVASALLNDTVMGARTVGPMDTTGATLLAVFVGVYNYYAITVTDSKNNVWTKGVGQLGGWSGNNIYYCIHPSTDVAHTITVSAYHPVVAALAFATPEIIQVGQTPAAINVAGRPATIQTPAIIPTANSLVLTMAFSNFRNIAELMGEGLTAFTSMAAYGRMGLGYWAFASADATPASVSATGRWDVAGDQDYSTGASSMSFNFVLE